MLNKALTTEEMLTQIQRGEIIAQALARQRDEANNKVAILETDLMIERTKTEQLTKQVEALQPKPVVVQDEDDGA